MLEAGTVLIDNNFERGAKSFLYQTPSKIIIAKNASEVDCALLEIEQAIINGNFVAGYFSYELGYCFEPPFKEQLLHANNEPLIWMGVYKNRIEFSNEETQDLLDKQINGGGFRIRGPEYSQNQEQYSQKFSDIHRAIECGTIYQTNLTFMAKYRFWGSPIALYSALRKAQKTTCGAYVSTGESIILSRSPEIFFELKKTNIKVIPMKGTLARAKDVKDDKANIAELQNDEKQRAENLMIVDLMRNDLSRISEIGSVKVSKLFAIETYDTLHQMVSTIDAKLKRSTSISQIVRAIFPCGSITGAPKISAMEQIAIHETEPRGVYCGAIGHFTPDGFARFNVAIRTALIKQQEMTIGIGSGIVYDSNPRDEYLECKLKASFVEKAIPKFAIFETILWQKNFGFHRLERHLRRLKNSADALAIFIDEEGLIREIDKFASEITHDYARVRIELGERISIKEEAFIPTNNTMRFAISSTIMQSNNPWLCHKTTQREVYDNEWFNLCTNDKIDEVVYFNERGELTEGSRTNVFVDFGDGSLATPPIDCGLLPGILREELLETGRAKEQIIDRDSLKNAKQIYLGNSLRGLRKAILKSI